jgi:DNA uptake protein ComE-like DNA-binding protein
VRSGPTAESAPRDRGGSPVIVLSLVLVIAAAVLLVLGIFFQDGLLLIYLSIGSCLLAMALLGAGVLLRRRETAAGVANGGAATASATAGTASVGSTAVRGRNVEGPRVPSDDGADRDDTVEVRPVQRAVVREPAAGVDPVEAGTEPAAGSSDHRAAANDQAAAAPVASSTAGAVRPPAKRAVVKKAVVRKQTAAPAAEPSAATSGVSGTPVAAVPAKKATAKKATAKKATAKKATAKKATASAAPVKRATTTKATPAATSTSTGRGLDAVKGLGPAKRQALLDRFGSEDGVRAASIDELTQVRGIGAGLARSIKEALG